MTKTKQLYPITFRPGIKRDGTPFQAEYCSDGDWVRWQKGMPRSMRGMVTPLRNTYDTTSSPALYAPTINDPTVSDILAINNLQAEAGGFGRGIIVTASTGGIIVYNYHGNVLSVNTILNTRVQPTQVLPEYRVLNLLNRLPGSNTLWQSLLVTRQRVYSAIPVDQNPFTHEKNWVLYYGCANRLGFNITYGKPIAYGAPSSGGAAFATFDPVGQPIDRSKTLVFDNNITPNDIDGGACYAAPFLFLFGTGGTVRVSRAVDCFDFRTPTSEANQGGLSPAELANGFPAQVIPLPVSDKVICGFPIRAGANSPTLLFWTLSSLIRTSNVATTSDVQPQFKSDVISQSISILSNKCVVEYDGLFFWPGFDRFYVYNGNTNVLPNTISNDFFFNNLDPNKAALVFGVKKPRYGEIWWYYPEIANAANPDIGCTRVIIYNKAENSWYDVAATASAGTYVPWLGKVITFGVPKIQDVSINVNPQLWVDDVDGQQISQSPPIGINPRNVPVRVNLDIPKFFTTPYFSFTAFNPLKQQVGADNQTLINRLEPDFKSSDGKNTSINVDINTIAYGNSQVVTARVGTIVIDYEDIKGNIPLRTEKVDMAIQGGAISLTFSTTDSFEMGHNLVLLSVGDGNR